MRISDWSSDVCSSDLGVDFAGEIVLYELIHGIRERLGCGILMISHDLHIVMGKTDTVVCLNGHVCCSGTPQAVTESPEYRALFGSEAAAALAIYRHDHDHRHLDDGRVLPDHLDHHIGRASSRERVCQTV